ncbi:MAG: hypothetical protein PHU63_02360 [Candidatus ainarchaeum sp.]|nr:hypothetical protein [Candidatus ainarchaeum sp.]
MEIETITLPSKRKKSLSSLIPLFSDLGFSKISLEKKKLIIEKSLGKNLEGKTEMDYKVVFSENEISFSYSIPINSEKRNRKIESFSTLLNILSISNDFYNFNISSIVQNFSLIIQDVQKIIDKEGINFTQRIDDLINKNTQIMKKYHDLLSSSEENARLLIDSERRNNELRKRLDILEGLSDRSLKEEIFNWIKIHDGHIDVLEFSKTHKIPHSRVEEGLNLLIKEGYIKKK